MLLCVPRRGHKMTTDLLVTFTVMPATSAGTMRAKTLDML